MLITTAFASCTNESEDLNNLPGKNLKVSFNVAEVQSRAIFTEASLPTASVVGAKLDGYDNYSSITFTANGTGQAQTWTPSTDVVLSEDQGTLYTYFPYSQNTDISAIPVDMTEADQTDWLYGTPVTGVSEDNASVTVTLNHALANINLSFADGTYAGVGNITSVSVSGDGIATGGTFNAAQETPGFVADSYTGVGDAITNTTATTLGGNAIDIMVVSNDAEKPITIAATIDGVEYTATTTAVELAKGNSYQYTLTLNSTFMSVSNVSVTPWNNVAGEDLTLDKVEEVIGTIDLTTAANGVYAVAKNGLGAPVEDADESCIAVALIVTDAPTPQRIMIEKNEDSNAAYGGESTFFWGDIYTEITEIPDLQMSTGYLGDKSYDRLERDYTKWKSGPLSDFNGKNNSAAMIAASTQTRYIDAVLNTFNTLEKAEGRSDEWYIPALGQLALIYLNRTAINNVLINIGGKTFVQNGYWSSSEYSTNSAWPIYFYNSGQISATNKGGGLNHVRFVRDIN